MNYNEWLQIAISYYDALGAADAQADSSGFAEFMPDIINESLKEITIVGHITCQDNAQVTDQDKSSAKRLFSVLDDDTLSASMRLGLSHRPTFRKNYLNPVLEQQLTKHTIPNKPNSWHQKYIK